MSRPKKQKEVRYTVSARMRGTKERFALLFSCCLDFATERLPELERDPEYNSRFTDFRITPHDFNQRLWNHPRYYNTGE